MLVHPGDSRLFRIDNYFKFINFELYSFTGDSNGLYLVIYAVMVGIFYFIAFSMFALAKKMFEAARSESLGEGAKYTVNAFSGLMTLYLTVF